ncbi:MAG: hypothetical protein MJA27_17925 [Pseudanabaenales cyanobacterium]|nr:hypothetical protein [Pseudanabaenales cyanobacterium]
MNSSPERKGERLSFEQIKDAVTSLHSLNPLQVVIFAGGEPTLLSEDLLESVAYIDSLGIATRIVTNASWAITPEKARSMLISLREAGLREINFSVDDYHLPFISFEKVKNAWFASKGLGFQSVVLANCWGHRSTITPQYIMDRLGEKLPQRFDDDGYSLPIAPPYSDGTVYMLSNSKIQNLGRSHEELDRADIPYPDSQEELNVGCPWAVKSAALSPKGHLVACCGMEAENNEVLDFGDASTTPASDLVKFADNQVVINVVSFFGLIYLKNFIQERNPDIPFLKKYASVCEICEHIVTRPECIEVLRKNSGKLAASVLAVREATGDK